MLTTILLLFALACFVAAALGVTSRVNLLAAGLSFWVLSILLTGRF